MKVAIVLPGLNQWHYTRDCLNDLAATVPPATRIIVVDNASTDETPAGLARQAGLTVVSNPENLGCAKAWNQGVAAAPEADAIVVLNNDVRLAAGWLEGLLAFAAAEDAGIASPGIREGELNYDFSAYARAYTAAMRDTVRWGAANGICFLVQRRVFNQVGMFDENFRIGQFEDADFFRRTRLAGFRLGSTGRSFLHHFGSITQNALRRQPGVRPYEAENRAYFRAKWRLGWFRRRWDRWVAKTQTARWSRRERSHCGHTLHEKWLAGRLQYF